MLLRRITQHVKDQNWFAVGIDFFIVVIGVFLGIQVANWNAGQVEKKTAQVAVERVQAELSSNQDVLQSWIDYYLALRVHATATMDGLERSVEERGKQFVVDAYQVTNITPVTLRRDAYNDFLSLGSVKALIDEDILQNLASYYFFLGTQTANMRHVPAYRSRLRSIIPHDVQTRIRIECRPQIDIFRNFFSLAETCEPKLSEDQVERAVAKLSAIDFKPDLNLALTDLAIKIAILRIIKNTSQELNVSIEENN